MNYFLTLQSFWFWCQLCFEWVGNFETLPIDWMEVYWTIIHQKKKRRANPIVRYVKNIHNPEFFFTILFHFMKTNNAYYTKASQRKRNFSTVILIPIWRWRRWLPILSCCESLPFMKTKNIRNRRIKMSSLVYFVNNFKRHVVMDFFFLFINSNCKEFSFQIFLCSSFSCNMHCLFS